MLHQGYNQDAVQCACSGNVPAVPLKVLPYDSMDLAATPLATVLADSAWICSQKPHLTAYRGALTPGELDVRQSEIEALTQARLVHDLGWLRRVEVRGEDRFRWLSGMVTNTVIDLAANTGAWNLVLNAQGRIQGDLTVWREGKRSGTGDCC